MFISQQLPSSQQLISGHLKDYISRSPMCITITECEFKKNIRDGCIICDFWKGFIVFHKTLVEENEEAGINVINTYLPMQQENLTEGQSEAEDVLQTSRGLVDRAIEIDEKQHLVLGKVFLLEGSEVMRNQTGLKLHNCVCEIDEDCGTKIQDNRSM